MSLLGPYLQTTKNSAIRKKNHERKRGESKSKSAGARKVHLHPSFMKKKNGKERALPAASPRRARRENRAQPLVETERDDDKGGRKRKIKSGGGVNLDYPITIRREIDKAPNPTLNEEREGRIKKNESGGGAWGQKKGTQLEDRD